MISSDKRTMWQKLFSFFTAYRWLSSVLKRSLYSLKISSTVAHNQVAQKEAAYFNVRNQIEALETKAEDQIDIMKHGFCAEVDIVTRLVHPNNARGT